MAWKPRNSSAKNNVYSFKNLGDDLAPYSLYPKEEIAKLLHLTFILISVNVSLGKTVQIPKFGQFFSVHIKEELGKGRHPITGVPMTYPDRNLMRFKPYPFVRWLMAPHQRSGYVACKQDKYRLYLDKVKAVLIHSAKYLGFFQEVCDTSYISPQKQLDYEAKSANPRKKISLNGFK